MPGNLKTVDFQVKSYKFCFCICKRPDLLGLILALTNLFIYFQLTNLQLIKLLEIKKTGQRECSYIMWSKFYQK